MMAMVYSLVCHFLSSFYGESSDSDGEASSYQKKVLMGDDHRGANACIYVAYRFRNLIHFSFSMTDENTDRFCTPGERLASVLDGTTQYRAGLGTFESGNYICSSLVGKVVEKTVQEDGDSYIVVHVVQEHPSPVLIPRVGDVVVCKVVRISQKHVFLDILQVKGKDVVEKFSGLIRNSDIRSSDIDALEVHRCFRPRDIVRAKVLSLGDARAYYLTTAEKGLGVVSCRSQTTGDLMIPLDETCMICKETQEKEERKACVQL